MEPWRRLYLMSFALWLPAFLLIVVLSMFYGGTPEWTEIYLTIAAVAAVGGCTFIVLGAVRRIKDQRGSRGAL
ncbi:MAG TPA: hypothetical protein VH520_04095 [Streptosporangiaceae bacterium]|jgi:hypothetical protein